MNKGKDRKKQAGFIVTVELLFILVILVIGLITGWIVVRNAVIAELSDTAAAVGALDQSYAFTGTASTNTVFTAGSNYADAPDIGEFPDTVPITGDANARGSITVTVPPTGE